MIVAAIFAIVFLAGGAAALFHLSLVRPMNVVLPSLAAGFVAALLLRGTRANSSGTGIFLVKYLLQGALFSSLIAFAFLGINFAVDGKGIHKETVTVERLYSKTFHRTKRVGRRYVGRGEPYKVYYMEVSFTDKKTKVIRLGQSGYGKREKGDRLELEIGEGFFGIPVIKSDLSSIAMRKRER